MFSVVIPCFQFNQLLLKSLHCVQNQELKPKEIIIVFSNKISKSQKNLLIEKNKNLRFFFSNCGNASENRNLGALKAKGSYIAFLDDDDIWGKKYLKQINKILKKKRSKLVITWLNKIKNNRISKFKHINKNIRAEDLFASNPGIIGSNLVVEKKVFKKLGGFDKKLLSSEDKDFLIRYLDKKFKFEILKKRLVNHRQKNENQLSFDTLGKQFFLKKYENRMSNKDIYENKKKIVFLKLKKLSFLKKVIYYLYYFYILGRYRFRF